jgi:hypothetical protein
LPLVTQQTAGRIVPGTFKLATAHFKSGHQGWKQASTEYRDRFWSNANDTPTRPDAPLK